MNVEVAEISSIWPKIIQLIRWNKPSGRLIVILSALWAMFLSAHGMPPVQLIALVVLIAIAGSAGGCAINDIWDRDIDPHLERTAQRPLASQVLSVKTAVVVFVATISIAILLSLLLNPLSLCLFLLTVPVIFVYPLSKRVFPVPQLLLALALGGGSLVSWSAVSGSLEVLAWLLWGATVLWTLGFDTIYAVPDWEDDRRLGVHSSALFFGSHTPSAVAVFFSGTVLLMAILGALMSMKIGFWIALCLAAGVWTSQWIRLNDVFTAPSLCGQILCGQMFKENVWIGFLLLGGIIAGV